MQPMQDSQPQSDRIVAMSAAQCRAARALLGLSRSDLARIASVGERTLADFESGARTPIRATLAALQRALEVTGVEFLPDDGVKLRAGSTAEKRRLANRARARTHRMYREAQALTTSISPGTRLHILEPEIPDAILSENAELNIRFANGRHIRAQVETLSRNGAIIRLPDGSRWQMSARTADDATSSIPTQILPSEEWIIRGAVASGAKREDGAG